LGGGENLRRRIEGFEAFELGEKAGFALDKTTEFPASKHQIQGDADVRDEDDDEQPGEGVSGLAFLGEEAGDEEKSQQEARDRKEVRDDGVGEDVMEKLHAPGAESANGRTVMQAAREAEKVLELDAVTREFPRPFSW
jgi:hypothetical protein